MTRRIHAVLGAGLALAAAGCAVQDLPDDTTSHISGASFRDSSALTVFMADILARSLDAPRSTLILAPYAGDDSAHAEILLTDTLRERGFALSPGGMAYPGGHTVRYAVSPMGQNLVLELDVDDAAATCLYGHDVEGALRRTGSCTLRSGRQLTLRIPPEEVLVTASATPTHSDASVSAVPLAAPTPGAPMPLHPAVPLTPAPAPVPPPRPPVETWTLVQGQAIRDQMIAWGDRAAWHVIWPRDVNWMVPVTTSLSGDFKTVVGQVITAVNAQGRPLRVQFFAPNRTVLITSTGDR